MILKFRKYCLIFILWFKCIDCSSYSTRPKIETTDGDLTIQPGHNKNIYLKTNGPNSGIFLNNVNLLDVNRTANDVISEKAIDFQDSFDNVYRRLNLLENKTPETIIDYVNRSSLQERLNEINDRLVVLERKQGPVHTDLCKTQPCRHGGTCLDLTYRRHCLCPPNWEGVDCDEDVNECRNFAGTDLGCQNGGLCLNKPGSYECLCKPGWFGVHCIKRAKDCSGSNFETCGHGTCVSVTTGEGIKCLCDQGWTNNGSLQCLTDIDECDPKFGARCSTNPKVNCINLPGAFWCGPCPTGYEGDGYVCSDIDECLNVDNGGCSVSPKVACHNTIGSRICGSCPHGYEGDGIQCKWRGSCNINNGNCYPNAQCVDNTALGTTQCICPDGMKGDGFGITGCFIPGSTNTTGHCNNNPCGIHGTCHLVGKGFTCICRRGYSGLHCEIQQNYCNNNPCGNGGTCYSDSSKTRGFRCECSSQFSGDRCQVHMKGCGGVLDAEEGTLAYPNNNHSYSHNSRCAWVIHTSFDKVINVTFTKFNLEDDTDCTYDFLQIHDGRSSAAQLIDRFCGNKFPRNGNIISSHNNLYLWFRSDATIAKNGFALHWTSIKPLCGGEVNASIHGQISSPGSPGKYPPNRDCFWHLRTTLGKRIQILFFTLDIEIHQNCSYDHISIYDGEQVTDPLLSKLCNSSLPPPIQSAGSDLLIHFHSDPYGSGKGFQITFAPMPGVPGCGGYYTDDRSEISSPSFKGRYLNRVICEYKIKTSLNTIIKINFNAFSIESSFNCRFDYLKIYDGPSSDSRLVGTFCGRNGPKPYISSSNNLYLVFKSDGSVSSEGFKMTYEALCQQKIAGDSGVIKSPGYPFVYPRNKICEYLIITDPGKAIQLTFQDFELENNQYFKCRYDNVEVRDGSNENSTLMGRFCGYTIPPNQISTHNYMYVRFVSDMSLFGRGFYANYTTINTECGGIYKNTSGIINFPTDDNRYKQNQTCIWVLQAPPGMIIKITWNRFILEDGFRCSYDYLELFEVDIDRSNFTLGRYCGRKAPPSLTTTTNEIILKFVSDFNTEYRGFSLTYSFLDAEAHCGGTYLNIHGQINSPGWPNQYPPNRDCTWIIQARKGQQIRLNISNFDLERPIGTRCDYGDYLEIRNGATNTSPLIGKYCGSFQSKIIKSITNTLYLRFHSDITIINKGFQIEWDSTVSGCGGTLTSSSGSITSPNYPKTYDDNAECFYKIIVNSGSQIKFEFIHLDLEESDDCRDDYVEIFDGRDENSLSLGKFCLMSLLKPNTTLKTSSNQAFIKFRSDILLGGSGFWLNYESICNMNLTGSYGVIESPDFPSTYKPGLSCLWTINVLKGNKINITFTNFDIYKFYRPYFSHRRVNFARYPYVSNATIPNCIDYVQIKEKRDLNFTTKYCGNELPAPISSKTESIQIQFQTRSYVPRTGFRLEWVRYGCGGRIQRNYGNIDFRHENILSEKQIECEWLIETAVGTSIDITFTKLYMIDLPNCVTDAIEVYNGQDTNSPRIAKFCHNDVSIYHSTSNVILVKFIKQSSLKDAYFMSYFDSRPSTCGGWIKSLSGVIHSKNYPKNYDDDLNCDWKLQVSANHKIELQFEDLDLYSDDDKNDTNCGDSIRIYDDSKVWPLICANSKATSITSRTNVLHVKFISDNFGNAKGFKANFSVTCGALITNASEGIITSDSFDQHSNKSCVWVIMAPRNDEKVAITITYMSIHKDHSNIITSRTCPTAYLRVHDGNDVNGPLIDEYCGNRVPPMIVSQGSAVTLELGSYVSGIHKGMFTAHYTTLTNACGGVLSSEEGYIASPKFPLSYPPNIDCEWILRTSPGNKVYILFEDFDLENSEHCNEDYLEIRENDGVGPIVGIYCGSEIPINTTMSSKLYIKFHSNGKAPGKGFLIRYGFLHGNEIQVSKNGQIASPMYPYKFHGNGEFFWRLITNGSNIIDIRIDELEIASFRSSCYNSLTIYDGYDDEGPILERLCGAITRDTKTLKSTSNVIFIKLKLNDLNIGSTFLLSYSKSSPVDNDDSKINCGSIEPINVAPGQIIIFNSTNYPKDYENNLNCQWVFFGSSGRHLSLQFITLKLEETFQCFADYITVFASYNDNPTVWKEVKDKICLSENVQKEISPPNVANLKMFFKTDSSVVAKGFSARVTSECGGYITDLSGSFGVTEIDSRMRSKQCEWKIKVRPGRTIKIYFEYFNITNTKYCDSFVTLKNGDSNDAPMLGHGKFCGFENENRSELVTSSNTLFVKYVTKFVKQGFKIRYEENNIECGLTSTLEENHKWEIIKSPNYPSVPPSYIECIWVFSGPPGETLRVDFINRFDIKNNQECTEEAVEIKDGASSFSPVIGRYCGEKPPTIKSSNNQIYIKYLTRLREPRNGFAANISINICGGTLKGNVGEITSPSFPHMPALPEGTICQWHVIGPVGKILKFTTQYMNLPISNTECGTNVTIEESTEVTNNTVSILETFCSHDISGNSKSIITSSNTATLKFIIGKESSAHYNNDIFHSDSPKGFKFSFISYRQKCGGLITTPEGFVTTPGYPRYITATFCKWDIIVPNKLRRIRLTIIDVDDKKLSMSITSHIDIITPINNKTFESLGNKLSFFIFLRDHLASPHRFKAKFDSDLPALCGGELNKYSGYINSPVSNKSYTCEWELNISPPQENRLNYTYGTVLLTGFITGVNSSLGKHKCFYFDPTLSIKSDLMVNEKRIGSTFSRIICVSDTFTYRIPNSNIFLFASKPEDISFNFHLKWKLQPCGGVLNIGQTPINVLDNIPNKYNDSLDCAWFISSNDRVEIQLKGNFILDCNDEFLTVQQGISALEPITEKYCKDSTEDSLITLRSSQIYIQYHSKPKNNTDIEILAKSLPNQCGGYLTWPNLYFTTPNYPKNYLDNQECTWEISANVGFRISLKFIERFAIEFQPNCTKDSVIIYDWRGESWIEISRLCGRNLPPMYNSTQNKMKITFRSDNSTHLDGFKAEWTSVCGGVYIASKNEQIMQSPGYQNYYYRKLNCIYEFVTYDNEQDIEIKILEFNIDGPYPSCNDESVTLALHDRNKIITLCGTQPVQRYLSKNVTLTFRTNALVQRKVFKISYAFYNCGGNITKPTEITATSNGYGNQQNCTWFIEAPKSQIVTIKFLSISMDNSYECYNAYIGVYSGKQIDANNDNRLALLCGYLNSSTIIESPNNTMTLNYYNNHVDDNHGFNARILFRYSESVGCGGYIYLSSLSTRTLRSPLLGGSPVYENFLHCHWKIEAPIDQTLKIEFTSFHIAPCKVENKTNIENNCECDSVEIRDGLNPGSFLIGAYCGHNIPRTITTSSNKVSIQFLTDGEITSAGFELKVTAQQSMCGQSHIEVTNHIKSIKSPGYSANTYIPRGIHCIYHLLVPDLQTIHLRINKLDIKPGFPNLSKCNKDKLIITFNNYNRNFSYGKDLKIDGGKDDSLFSHSYLAYTEMSNIPELIEYCGRKEAIDLYIHSSITISLQTVPDADAYNYKGVDIEFIQVGGCTRNRTDTQGRISKSSLRNDESVECAVLITAPENHTISLQFLQIDIWNHGVYLDVFDGNTTENRIMRIEEESPEDTPIFSNSRYILLVDHDMVYSSYDLNYYSTDRGRGCGGSLNGIIGKISSPLYPDIYRHKGSCEWQLETPHLTRLRLHFRVFDLGRLCDQNYLQILDRDGVVITTYCSEMPADYTMEDNYAKIVFTTTRNNAGTGWVLEFVGVA